MMSDKKNHNTIYFLTTLSVYLGLVVVGASPQMIAIENFQNVQSTRFEISSRTNDVLADLEKTSNFERQDILPFTFFGVSNSYKTTWNAKTFPPQTIKPTKENLAENNQVFVITNFPRASI